ncbi:MAG TPA: hypothetical protein VF634_01955, partial [Pyrinomonadaceae bacterium]
DFVFRRFIASPDILNTFFASQFRLLSDLFERLPQSRIIDRARFSCRQFTRKFTGRCKPPQAGRPFPRLLTRESSFILVPAYALITAAPVDPSRLKRSVDLSPFPSRSKL